MFYTKKIRSIRPSDVVLEIGPGSTPHHRANEFLELNLESETERIAQRAGVVDSPDYRNRQVHYYDGEKFPFKDKQFDYVICSHVIEHVQNPELFLSELFRVGGGRGYIEYPLITCEYLYNFSVHTQFIKYDQQNKTLRYLPKNDTNLSEFLPVSNLLRKMLELGWGDLCSSNKELFFEGFEFDAPFAISKAESICSLIPLDVIVKKKSFFRRGVTYFLDRFNF